MDRANKKILKRNNISVLDVVDLKGVMRPEFVEAFEASDFNKIKLLIEEHKNKLKAQLDELKEEDCYSADKVCHHCGSRDLFTGPIRNRYSPQLQCADCGREQF